MLIKASPKNLYLTNPTIAKEWHPSKNGGLTPKDATLNFNRKVWWLCSNDHVWSATVNERIQGNSCPYCAGEKIEDEKIPNVINPSPTEEIPPEKNEKLKQKDTVAHQGKKVSSENCLQTINPKLAKEWHPTKNGNVTPKDVAAFSHEQVWWLCSQGHEWKAAISGRSNGQGCFYCSYMHKQKH